MQQIEGIRDIVESSHPPQLRFNTKSRVGSVPAIDFSTNVRTSKMYGMHFICCIAVIHLDIMSLFQ